MLLPKKTKFRKVRIGKNDGVATRGHYVAFGDYGLQSLDNERITSRQIESARQAMTRYIKRGGKIWIRIFPHQLPASRLVSRWAVVKASQNSSLPKSSQVLSCSR